MDSGDILAYVFPPLRPNTPLY